MPRHKLPPAEPAKSLHVAYTATPSMPTPYFGSERFHLAQEDLKRIGKGALIAAAGALLTYLADALPSIDFGSWTPVVVSVFSILVNIARKFLTDTRPV